MILQALILDKTLVVVEIISKFSSIVDFIFNVKSKIFGAENPSVLQNVRLKNNGSANLTPKIS